MLDIRTFDKIHAEIPLHSVLSVLCWYALLAQILWFSESTSNIYFLKLLFGIFIAVLFLPPVICSITIIVPKLCFKGFYNFEFLITHQGRSLKLEGNTWSALQQRQYMLVDFWKNSKISNKTLCWGKSRNVVNNVNLSLLPMQKFLYQSIPEIMEISRCLRTEWSMSTQGCSKVLSFLDTC